eukprot:10700579-Heterocapsa_arctica.AAC.1
MVAAMPAIVRGWLSADVPKTLWIAVAKPAPMPSQSITAPTVTSSTSAAAEGSMRSRAETVPEAGQPRRAGPGAKSGV